MLQLAVDDVQSIATKRSWLRVAEIASGCCGLLLWTLALSSIRYSTLQLCFQLERSSYLQQQFEDTKNDGINPSQ